MSPAQRTQDAAVAALAIRNSLDALLEVEDWLGQVVARFAIPPRAAFSLDLILNEALPNIIDYAYDDDGAHIIRVALHDCGDSLLLEIVDDGVPFNPFVHGEYHEAPDLASATPDGRGIHLIKSFSDTQEYRREADLNILRCRVTKQPDAVDEPASAVVR